MFVISCIQICYSGSSQGIHISYSLWSPNNNYILLKYRKRRPYLECFFCVFFGTRFAFLLIYLFNRMRCKPFCLFCLPADYKFRLSPLFKNRNINIGTDMGEKICAINYWNLFFQNEYKHEAMIRCHLNKNPVHIPGPTQWIRAHIPGLINHSNFRISQDIS